MPGTGRSWAAIVKEAIDGAFVPLTETPPVYRQLRDTALQTSGRPPKVRDANGNRLYHLFRVVAMNSAGLLSVQESVLSV